MEKGMTVNLAKSQCTDKRIFAYNNLLWSSKCSRKKNGFLMVCYKLKGYKKYFKTAK